jgi:hypothetical protein
VLRRLLVMLGACLLLAACRVSVHVGSVTNTTVRQPRIASVVLSTDYQNGQPVGETTVFRPNSTFHAVVQVSGAESSTTVKAAWTAVDAGGDQNRALDQKEITVPTDRAVDFTLSLPRPWPSGSYRVDIYLNGQLDHGVDFTVQ